MYSRTCHFFRRTAADLVLVPHRAMPPRRHRLVDGFRVTVIVQKRLCNAQAFTPRFADLRDGMDLCTWIAPRGMTLPTPLSNGPIPPGSGALQNCGIDQHATSRGAFGCSQLHRDVCSQGIDSSRDLAETRPSC